MNANVRAFVALFALSATALGVAIYAAQYLTKPPDAFPFIVQREIHAAERLALLVHVSMGGLALLVGPMQFLLAKRTPVSALHRVLGRVYVASVLASAAAGAWLAPTSFGSPVSSAGFMALAILWPAATWLAVRAARNGDFERHRVWMIRSYAMTFAAATLRAELGVLIYFVGLRFEDAYQIVAWSSWTLNLIAADWMLASARRR
ncbi:MAG: DUF2306 domain-containing protein [Alphaproteobacteria bacterium]|nr:DUF2306 domain-containing protein [Alphaproteobacteria bacterium]